MNQPSYLSSHKVLKHMRYAGLHDPSVKYVEFWFLLDFMRFFVCKRP